MNFEFKASRKVVKRDLLEIASPEDHAVTDVFCLTICEEGPDIEGVLPAVIVQQQNELIELNNLQGRFHPDHNILREGRGLELDKPREVKHNGPRQ